MAVSTRAASPIARGMSCTSMSTGRLCACVTHPATDVGAWREASGADDCHRGGAFVLDDERDGLRVRWDGYRHSLEHHSRALDPRTAARRAEAPAEGGGPDHCSQERDRNELRTLMSTDMSAPSRRHPDFRAR